MSDVDTSAEACAVACMLVSNPAGETRHAGWQKRVNDLIRALRAERDKLARDVVQLLGSEARAENAEIERDALRAELAATRAAVIEECARAQVPLPAWVDDDPDDRLAAAAYDFERAFRKAIRSLAKGDEP